MATVAQIASPADSIGLFGPARVVANAPDHRVMVRTEPGMPARSARLAASLGGSPGPGDEVLVTSAGGDELVVISILTAGASAQPGTLRTPSGATATIDDRSETLRVYSSTRELLFEYDSESGKARVIVATGDIEFVAPHGDLRFSAAGDIQLDGRTLDLNARSGLRLGVRDALGRLGASLVLGKRLLRLQASEAALSARQGEFNVEQTRFTAARVRATFGRLRLVAETVETLTQTVIDKARDVYRTVQGVSQLQAGRVSTRVTGTYHMKSRQTILKSDEDIKVNAERIHLG